MAKRTNKTANAANVVAEICLYGTHKTGAGYLVRLADGRMFGDGSPVEGRSFTHACFLAMDEVRNGDYAKGGTLGYAKGVVRIYEPNGAMFAEVDAAKTCPWYGSLKWQSAQQYAVSVDQIVEAAAGISLAY